MGSLRNFQYLRARTVREAVRLLGHPGARAKAIAGGTDLLVQMRAGDVQPDCLLDLKGIRALACLSRGKDLSLKIGAAVDLRTIETDEAIRRDFSPLAEAAALVGSVQIRNLGTVGGNVCNAAPSAETAPALLVLDARAHVAGSGRSRTLPLANFFVAPGKTVLAHDEILTAIELPPVPPRSGASYLRISTRKAMDIAVVAVAALLVLEPGDSVCREARIALGAVAPKPIRVPQGEELLKGQVLSPSLLDQAAAAAASTARPISDVRGSAEYRRQMVEVLTRRALTVAFKQAKKEG